jgi:hypothetical protein
MIRSILRLYCRLAHGEPYLPFRGAYRCRVCLREFAVDWHGRHPSRGARS